MTRKFKCLLFFIISIMMIVPMALTTFCSSPESQNANVTTPVQLCTANNNVSQNISINNGIVTQLESITYYDDINVPNTTSTKARLKEKLLSSPSISLQDQVNIDTIINTYNSSAVSNDIVLSQEQINLLDNGIAIINSDGSTTQVEDSYWSVEPYVRSTATYRSWTVASISTDNYRCSTPVNATVTNSLSITGTSQYTGSATLKAQLIEVGASISTGTSVTYTIEIGYQYEVAAWTIKAMRPTARYTQTEYYGEYRRVIVTRDSNGNITNIRNHDTPHTGTNVSYLDFTSEFWERENYARDINAVSPIPFVD